jgi:integrase
MKRAEWIPARDRGPEARPEAHGDRLLKELKAALNRALEDGLVESGDAWKRVKGFKGVEAARTRYLNKGELKKFLEACPPDFGRLVRAAVYTGARISEPAALRARDFRPEASAIYFEKTKTDAPRYVYLADEGFAFFEALVSRKKPNDLLLLKKDGEPWGRNHHYRVMKEACEEAKIEPLGFHQLRHTYASLYLMSGGSLVALAKQLGHTTTRMVEKHYGHLADSWRAEEARKHSPALGLESTASSR